MSTRPCSFTLHPVRDAVSPTQLSVTPDDPQSDPVHLVADSRAEQMSAWRYINPLRLSTLYNLKLLCCCELLNSGPQEAAMFSCDAGCFWEALDSFHTGVFALAAAMS